MLLFLQEKKKLMSGARIISQDCAYSRKWEIGAHVFSKALCLSLILDINYKYDNYNFTAMVKMKLFKLELIGLR